MDAVGLGCVCLLNSECGLRASCRRKQECWAGTTYCLIIHIIQVYMYFCTTLDISFTVEHVPGACLYRGRGQKEVSEIVLHERELSGAGKKEEFATLAALHFFFVIFMVHCRSTILVFLNALSQAVRWPARYMFFYYVQREEY